MKKIAEGFGMFTLLGLFRAEIQEKEIEIIL